MQGHPRQADLVAKGKLGQRRPLSHAGVPSAGASATGASAGVSSAEGAPTVPPATGTLSTGAPSTSGRSEPGGKSDARAEARGIRTYRQWTPLARSLTATGDHWTLAIAVQLAPGAVRLTHLRRRLPGISTGVLDRYLQQMVALGLLSRTRYREMPPRVELELTEAGHELLPIAGALARWGMRRVWSDPQAGERIDVGALLRLMPVLLEEERSLPDGTLETVVLDPGQTVRHVFQAECGRLRASDAPNHIPSARVEGPTDAWIAALGPEGEYEQLRFSGDTQLARLALCALPRHP